MFNTILIVITSIVSLLGIILAVYYAFSIRKENVDSYKKRNPSVQESNVENNQLISIQHEPLKVFVYLDEDKMYSLSSQLFEGITNQIMSGDSSIVGSGESQKGYYASGSFMANMMIQQTMHSESRSLNDFAFTVFENELSRRNLLYCINKEDTLESLRGKGFVKVSGRISVHDYSNTLKTIEHFNEIGKAIGYLQYGTPLSENRLKEEGLVLDKSLQEHVKKLVSFGYKDAIEMTFSIPGTSLLYSATINRSFLKESEDIFISRYSGTPEKVFTVVGIVSQVGEECASENELQCEGLKKNIRDISSKIFGMYSAFNGRADNECIIDPIAIFTEIG